MSAGILTKDEEMCDFIDDDFMDFGDPDDDFFGSENYADDGSDLESLYETRTMITATTQSTGRTSGSSDSCGTSVATSKNNSSLGLKPTSKELRENAKLQRARKMIYLRFLEEKARQISLHRFEKYKKRSEEMTTLKDMKDSFKETTKLTISFLFGGAREYVDPLSLPKFMSRRVVVQLPMEPFWGMAGFNEVSEGRRVLSGLNALHRYRKMYNIKMESISRHGTGIPRFLTFCTTIVNDSFMVSKGKAAFSFVIKSKNVLLCGGSSEVEANCKCFATFEESSNALLTLDVYYDSYEFERKLSVAFGPSIYCPLNVAALVPLAAPVEEPLSIPQTPSSSAAGQDAIFCLEIRDNENEAYQSLSFDDMKLVFQNDRFRATLGATMTERFSDSELYKLLFTNRQNAEGNRDIIQLLSWVPLSVHVGRNAGCTINSSSIAELGLRNAYYIIVPFYDGVAGRGTDSSEDKKRIKPNRLMVTVTKCREYIDKGVNILLHLNKLFLERTIANYKETTDMFIEFRKANIDPKLNPTQFITFVETAQSMLLQINSRMVLLEDGTIDFTSSDQSSIDDVSQVVVSFIAWMMAVEEAGMKPVLVEEFQETLQKCKRKLDSCDDAPVASSRCDHFADENSADDDYVFDADLAEVDLISDPLYDLFVKEKRVIKMLVQDLNIFYSQIRDSKFLMRDIVALLLRSDIEKNVKMHVEKVIFLCWTRHSSVQIQELLRSVSIYVSNKKYDEALSLISQVVAIDPAFAEGYNNRATLYFAQFDDPNFKPKVFFDDIQSVLSLEPDHYGAMYGNSLMHFRMHKYDETARQLKVAVSINPSLSLSKQVQKIMQTCDSSIKASLSGVMPSNYTL